MPPIRIEKTIDLDAPVSRVWRALTDFQEFGRWFGVQLDGPFVPGKPIMARFHQQFDEARLIEHQRSLGVVPAKIRVPDQDVTFCTVQCIEPEHHFSFRWVPFGIEAGLDLATEPTTLVEFTLEPIPSGTRLRIVESGFEQLPEPRRQRAFRMNEGGWAAQAENIRRHVEAH